MPRGQGHVAPGKQECSLGRARGIPGWGACGLVRVVIRYPQVAEAPWSFLEGARLSRGLAVQVGPNAPSLSDQRVRSVHV